MKATVTSNNDRQNNERGDKSVRRIFTEGENTLVLLLRLAPVFFHLFFVTKYIFLVHGVVIFICDCPGLRAQWPADPRPLAPQGEPSSSLASSLQWPKEKLSQFKSSGVLSFLSDHQTSF